MFTKRIAAVAVALVLGSCGVGAFGAGYQAISLDTPDNLSPMACGINDNGQIAIDRSGDIYIWDKGTMTLALANARPLGINNSGDVLGYRYLAEKDRNDALLLRNGVVTQFGALPGWDFSFAKDLNNRGQVVGFCEKESGNAQDKPGYIWDNGNMTNLGTFIPDLFVIATGLNDVGQVVGYTGGQGFVWEDGVMTDMESLMNHSGDGCVDINNNGDIAGFMFSAYDQLPGVWIDGHPSLLPMLAGYSEGSACMINDSGLVAGYLIDDEDLTRAAFWQDGVCQLLPTLGGSKSQVMGMNNKGQIVGWSTDNSGLWHATLWEPVPEPSSIFALITGLVGIGGIAIGRKR